jgi:hypothetical protein
LPRRRRRSCRHRNILRARPEAAADRGLRRLRLLRRSGKSIRRNAAARP